ncbi:TPA: restriction endonuclease subunit S [Escherichia coli]|uniref:restriction endonuclease subunit S n=1 Tax=Escherichia coli TaxID=562 RepID=UPI0004D7AE2D|nr:restriction endonuclease subunit S [Escherichia coli]ELO1898878.1 restriction endonuclease subunit S [Escherichia coli]ELO3208427.1 restriction endonuclease subunit S [Escherichia coli]KDU01169.1 type I restriction modification DNA specificity domain protein [Escherichia coli 3-267-03_S1_C2]HAJ4872862.1 restriction endonuclease subunit S [Escherichia coli]HAW1355454.1 restriction endonuclease subunit S [Escherichia coli]
MMKISEMPKYEVYKDSGVEWLGDIPASWSLLANKHIFRLKKKQVGKRSSEYDLLSLTLRGVIKRDMENPEGKFPAEFDTYQEVQCGDFIFCLFDVEETPRTVGLSPFNGMITGAYTVFELNDNFDNRFLYYFYMNLDAKKMLKPLYRGLRNTIPKDSFLSFKTFVPPHEQQTRIANFLDKKIALIDEAISIKEKQINLLKERKQIIIQQAVTQGLDPNVPMKDSGVDWIGKIPAHWNLMSLRYAFEFLNSRRVPISAVERESRQGVYPYYGASGVIDYVDDYIFDEDLILIAEDGANLLSKSTPLAFVATGKYWVNNHAHIIKPKFHGFKYWAELLSGLDYTVYISGAAQPKLTRDRLASVLVPVPPKDEIQEIISFIEGIEPDLNRTIDIQKSQIEKLKEYKTTLINSAVTGKIKITPEMVEQ